MHLYCSLCLSCTFKWVYRFYLYIFCAFFHLPAMLHFEDGIFFRFYQYTSSYKHVSVNCVWNLAFTARNFASCFLSAVSLLWMFSFSFDVFVRSAIAFTLSSAITSVLCLSLDVLLMPLSLYFLTFATTILQVMLVHVYLLSSWSTSNLKFFFQHK